MMDASVMCECEEMVMKKGGREEVEIETAGEK